MKKKLYSAIYKSILNCCIVLLSLACLPLFRGLQSVKSIDSPVFLSIEHNRKDQIVLEFDKEVQTEMGDLIPHGGFSIQSLQFNGSSMLLEIEGADTIGAEYLIEGQVVDENNNSLWFLIPFYGLNNNPAELIISEFINEHSSPRRLEKAEFYVQKSGNIGGFAVYNGSASDHKSSLVFDSQYVEEGEYIIVHFRSLEGSPEETGQINEYGTDSDALNRASSQNSIDNVRDFWVIGDQGLSDTNGAITIYSSPAFNARLLDAVLYSNRSYDPEASHGSFGTAYMWRVAQSVFEAGGWESEYDIIRPEDCFATEPSTSTRSINRSTSLQDTNSADDWHIVPSGKSSFGTENTDEVHS